MVFDPVPGWIGREDKPDRPLFAAAAAAAAARTASNDPEAGDRRQNADLDVINQ